MVRLRIGTRFVLFPFSHHDQIYSVCCRTALHEAARGGHVDVVEYLLERGLDINQRTHKGKGGSPLWWAKKIHGDDHPVVKYLKEKGAKNLKPE
mmetsp:Transcript_4113/g.8317  ORF Transcript_4113/g.8317 Transcript_4113/m.8317 type:complete len:94 (-) Transcript_4113:168-449(-)